MVVFCSVLGGAGCHGGESAGEPAQSISREPVDQIPEPVGRMPTIVSIGVPECEIGKVLTDDDAGGGCQYQGVPGLWHRSYANDSYALMARDPWRYLGLGFCRGQLVARVESSDLDCR